MAYFKANQKVKYIYPPIPTEPEIFPTVEPQPPTVDPSETPTDSTTALINDTNLVFYISRDDKNTMFKSLENQFVMVGTIDDDIDIINPIIKIDTNVDLTQYNYIYISALHRYYFCKVDLLYGGRYSVKCDVDVLMSYNRDLGVIPCIIDKESNSNDMYLNDGSISISSKDYNQIYNYSNGFNDSPSNILICCGG